MVIISGCSQETSPSSVDDASRLSFLAKPTVATVKGAITEASVATWQNESQTLVNPPTGNGATFNVTKPPATQLNPNAPVYRAAACDVTGGVASLNFDATELQIF